MIILLACFAYFMVMAVLVVLAAYDLRYYILPDKLNAFLAALFLIFHTILSWSLISFSSALVGAAVGGGLLLLIRQPANAFYKKDALGLGDVKLMAAAGIGLGFPNILLAMIAGSLIGLLHGALLWVWRTKKQKMPVNFAEINVPAGLGLALGIAIVFASQTGFGWLHAP